MKFFQGKKKKDSSGAKKIVTPLALFLGVATFPSALFSAECSREIFSALTRSRVPARERIFVGNFLCQKSIDLDFYLHSRFGKNFENTHEQALEVIQAIHDARFGLGDYLKQRQHIGHSHLQAMEQATFEHDSLLNAPQSLHSDFPF